MSAYIGRYAPSPTGRLHLGNLRSALISYLHSRLHDGHFILRIDDLDTPRNVPGADKQILDDLYWLGLDWDAIEIQSQRLHIYAYYFSELEQQGRIFACRCSRKDIAQALSAPHESDNKTLIYPGFCRQRKMSNIELQDAAWRFQVNDLKICFQDEVYGLTTQNLAKEVGDFVIKRRDHLYAYQFASAVDDMTMGITHVVRGSDLLDSTSRQIAIINSLGGQPPSFCHVPLMRDANGVRLSKRDGAMSLKQLKDQSPEAIIAVLARSIGLIDNECQKITVKQLLQKLTPEFLTQTLRRQSSNKK